MTDLEARCLEAFPQWIGSLAGDATAMADVLQGGSLPADAAKLVAGALNSVLKSLDLIPDSLEGLGMLDDAFVIRVASHLALAVPNAKDADGEGALARLGGDAALIAELLGGDNERLERFVRNLTHGAARGRTAAEIVDDEAARTAFLAEVLDWAKNYAAPSFGQDPKDLVKLKSFLGAKLPA